MDIQAHADNAVPIKAWDTVLFDKYRRFRYVLTEGLASHGDTLLERRAYPPGARVLDIGCGFGDTTRQIARRVGPGGVAVGVDCAPNFVASAAQEAQDAEVANASFFVADVQTDDLHGPYDHLFARFGTMFFNAPVLLEPVEYVLRNLPLKGDEDIIDTDVAESRAPKRLLASGRQSPPASTSRHADRSKARCVANPRAPSP